MCLMITTTLGLHILRNLSVKSVTLVGRYSQGCPKRNRVCFILLTVFACFIVTACLYIYQLWICQLLAETCIAFSPGSS